MNAAPGVAMVLLLLFGSAACLDLTSPDPMQLMASYHRANTGASRKMLAAKPDAGPTINCECTSEFDPVCGSDGEVHSNSCRARCDGVVAVGVPLVTSLGSCLGLNPPCRECHSVPEWKAATANISAASSCGCTNFPAPVCGADNTTYTNRCWAQCQNITEFFALPNGTIPGSPCVHPEVKPDWKPCASTHWCANRQHLYPPGAVCGSDGIAYVSHCEAECAGVKVVRAAPPGAMWKQPCPAANAALNDTCDCPDNVDPVCVSGGGYLYRNGCEAKCANKTVQGRPADGLPPLRSSCPGVTPEPVLLPAIVSRPPASG